MIVRLSPLGEPIGHSFDEPLELERLEGGLIIQGVLYDFSAIPEGATLPEAGVASGCPYILGSIERDVTGTLYVTVAFPHGRNAPVEARFPEPIHVTEDGPVELPFADWGGR